MPSIWISNKDYKILMRIKTSLEKLHKRDVGMPEVISYLLAATAIPSIPPEKDDELMRKVGRLREVVKKRAEKSLEEAK